MPPTGHKPVADAPEDKLGNTGEPTRISTYQRYTGLQPSNKVMVAFGQRGEMVLPKPENKKGVLRKSKAVRMIGYSQKSKGYIVVDQRGRRHHTIFVKFGHRRAPTAHRYTEKENRLVEEAIEKDPRKVDDPITEPLEKGVSIGLDDHELRDLAEKSVSQPVQYRAPILKGPDQINEPENFEKFDTVKQPDRGTAVMSAMQAEKILRKFVLTQGKGLYMHWRQSNPKTIGSKSHTRYDTYKHVKTYAEFVKAHKRKLFVGGPRAYRSSDCANDLIAGYLVIDKREHHDEMAASVLTSFCNQPADKKKSVNPDVSKGLSDIGIGNDISTDIGKGTDISPRHPKPLTPRDVPLCDVSSTETLQKYYTLNQTSWNEEIPDNDPINLAELIFLQFEYYLKTLVLQNPITVRWDY